MTTKLAIVIVAYNRKNSLQRLLKSVGNASYPKADIPLIISIDCASDNYDVVQVANAFKWKHGTKKVEYQKENLGLRNHILQCGAYAVTFGAAIILEDDLYVSPNYYQYTSEALQFANNKPYIAGISLYSHQFNVHSRSNFSPLLDGYDNWYFQFASSWGQAWTKIQWESFYAWYITQEVLEPHPSLPDNVTRWSEKSWLKYFIAYLVETDTYFLYPRASYTTNFSDMGTHVGKDTTTFQIPLDFSKDPQFQFSTLKESSSVYDVFYENRKLHLYLNLKEADLHTNLYGKKNNQTDKRYILTCKILPFKIIRKFGKSLKPHEANILVSNTGNDLFLYEAQIADKNSFKEDVYRKIMYDIKSLNRNEAKIVLFQLLKEQFNRGLKKLGL
ncbi:glycosyltransferase family 2 protein [Maribacter antarcticus]|uniref:glycosyltransferase family 2 protein n=1 Tax=Maribacter antarcticus TaxID=505250 RepID=UPI0006866EC5|nr:glycosyltransferase [Maribacter antarcticus]